MRCKIYVNIIIKVNNKNQNCSNGAKVANNNKLWNKKNNCIIWYNKKNLKWVLFFQIVVKERVLQVNLFKSHHRKMKLYVIVVAIESRNYQQFQYL